MAELTSEELTSILSKLDDVMQQAKELSATIKAKMAGERARDHVATDWTDRRQKSERRKKLRG